MWNATQHIGLSPLLSSEFCSTLAVHFRDSCTIYICIDAHTLFQLQHSQNYKLQRMYRTRKRQNLEQITVIIHGIGTVSGGFFQDKQMNI